MKINFITFSVRDLEKSLTFYRDLAGLKVVREISPGTGRIAFLANGEGEILLELLEMEDLEKISTTGMAMSFSAEEDLDAVRQRAADLGFAPSEIINHPPKPLHFVVKDPDGNTIEFGE